MYSHSRLDNQAMTAATGVIALGTAGIVGRLFPGMSGPVTVHGFWATVTVAFDTADTILTLKRRPTPGSATGEVTIATMTIPNGAAVGKQYYEIAAAPVKVFPGEEIAIETDGGTTAGVAAVGVVTTPSWEHPSNNANMITS